MLAFSWNVLLRVDSLQLRRTVFYTGVTNNLRLRVQQHKSNESKFTSKYKCHYLMCYEDFNDIRNAIARKKQLKKWLRKWKVDLIRKSNPDMPDHSSDGY
ncbi:MAG TPA: GIY-YIG nuclease family protein [Chitinophagaceae bacterium]|nr:GIY-YIG nuclease family protein [Chitinophagaceae bacterium]